MKQKIIFFGTPEHAKNVLQKFYEDENFEVVGVVTNPDRPVGRKKVLTPSPVKAFAEEQNIPVITPENFTTKISEKTEEKEVKKTNTTEKWLSEKNADFFIIVAYGTLIPQSVIDIPKKGTFNLHFSLLPKYRGASPVQSAILHGDAENTGISIFKLVPEMDAGEIFVTEKVEISGKTFEEAIAKMTAVGTQKFLEMCTNFSEISGISQNESEATFCGKFTKANGEISLKTETAEEIMRKFRAFSLWPGIFFFDEKDSNKRVKILEIQEISKDLESEISESFSENNQKKQSAGEFFLLKKRLFLQTVSGILEIIKIQKEGKKPISGSQYV